MRNVDPGVATTDLSVVVDDSYQHRLSARRYHIPKELKRTTLSSYHGWEVHAQAGVIKSTEQIDLLEGAYPAGLVHSKLEG